MLQIPKWKRWFYSRSPRAIIHLRRFYITNIVFFAFQASQDSFPLEKYCTFRISSISGFVPTREIQCFPHFKPFRIRSHSRNAVPFASEASQESLPLDRYSTFRISSLQASLRLDKYSIFRSWNLAGIAFTRQMQYLSHRKAHRTRFHSTNTVHLAFQVLSLAV